MFITSKYLGQFATRRCSQSDSSRHSGFRNKAVECTQCLACFSLLLVVVVLEKHFTVTRREEHTSSCSAKRVWQPQELSAA